MHVGHHSPSVQHAYKVVVVTGQRPGAGTSAGVYVVLCNTNEDSGKLWLDNGQRALSPGKTDIFEVSSCKLFSPVESLVIGHDNTGPSPGWFLEQV